ncbi:hypothetical protein B0H13DRAFT_195300 [Mycena leptocephala]|nr:hypothetical protein B0H13DRAFT_195300 [Mycena leptocephala]
MAIATTALLVGGGVCACTFFTSCQCLSSIIQCFFQDVKDIPPKRIFYPSTRNIFYSSTTVLLSASGASGDAGFVLGEFAASRRHPSFPRPLPLRRLQPVLSWYAASAPKN